MSGSTPTSVTPERAALAALIREFFPDKRAKISPAEFGKRAPEVEMDIARRFAEIMGIPTANLRVTPSNGMQSPGTLEIINPDTKAVLKIGRFEEMAPTSEGHCASISFEVLADRVGSKKYSGYWQTPPKYDLSHAEDILPRGLRRGSRAAFDAIAEDVEAPYSDDTKSPIYVFMHTPFFYPRLEG